MPLARKESSDQLVRHQPSRDQRDRKAKLVLLARKEMLGCKATLGQRGQLAPLARQAHRASKEYKGLKVLLALPALMEPLGQLEAKGCRASTVQLDRRALLEPLERSEQLATWVPLVRQVRKVFKVLQG